MVSQAGGCEGQCIILITQSVLTNTIDVLCGNAVKHFHSGTRPSSRIGALQGNSGEFHYIRNPSC